MDAGFPDEIRQFSHPLDIDQRFVVGKEYERFLDGSQLFDNRLRFSLEVLPFGQFPLRAEAAAKRAAFGGSNRRQRLHPFRIVVRVIFRGQPPIGKRETVEIGIVRAFRLDQAFTTDAADAGDSRKPISFGMP